MSLGTKLNAGVTEEESRNEDARVKGDLRALVGRRSMCSMSMMCAQEREVYHYYILDR